MAGIRLVGTEAECARLVFLLRHGPPDLEVIEVSKPYPSRDHAGQVRVYLEVSFPGGRPPVDPDDPEDWGMPPCGHPECGYEACSRDDDQEVTPTE